MLELFWIINPTTAGLDLYEVKEWEQYWYPVKGLDLKNANLNGAVNLGAEI